MAGGVSLLQQVGTGLVEQPPEFRLLSLKLEFGLPRLLFEFGIREDQQHGVLFHRRSGKHAAFLDPAAGLRRQPADLFGRDLQAAGSAHLPDQFPPLHDPGPDDRTIHVRNAGSEAAEQHQQEQQRESAAASQQQPPSAAFPLPVGDLKVHPEPLLLLVEDPSR